MTKWISIKEELPKQCVSVLVFSECGISLGWIESAPTEDPVFYVQEFGAFVPENITHWMPLPEPPK